MAWFGRMEEGTLHLEHARGGRVVVQVLHLPLAHLPDPLRLSVHSVLLRQATEEKLLLNH